MRDALKRALVAFTGMPDEPLRGCTGSCAQGHQACDCEIGAYIPERHVRVSTSTHRVSFWQSPDFGGWHQTEMVSEIPPSDKRTFSGLTADEKRAQRERNVWRLKAGAQAIVVVVGVAAVMAFVMLVTMH